MEEEKQSPILKIFAVLLAVATFITLFKMATNSVTDMVHQTLHAGALSEEDYQNITVSDIKTGKETVFNAAIKTYQRYYDGIPFTLKDGTERLQTFEGYKITVPGGIIKHGSVFFTNNKFNVTLTIKDTEKTEKYTSVRISENPLRYIPCIIILSDDGNAVIYSKSDIVMTTEELPEN